VLVDLRHWLDVDCAQRKRLPRSRSYH
jgi:hypothetical protein